MARGKRVNRGRGPDAIARRRLRPLFRSLIQEFGQYEYDEISETGTTRVLTLEPGDYDDTLEGSLTHMHLGHAKTPTYEAISYVWGNTLLTDYMLLDGKVLGLTSSIASALRRFRLSSKPRCLWADQICINQQNPKERSDQVKLMGALYRGCDRVLVWFGCDRDSRRAAVKLVNLLRALDDFFAHPELITDFPDPKMGYGAFSRDTWQALYDFNFHPWFTRSWIAQEIGTYAPATVFWGDCSIDWRQLHYTCSDLDKSYFDLPRWVYHEYSLNYLPVQDLYKRFVDDPYYPHRRQFVYNMIRMRDRKSQATDPRDYVFALLGHYSARVPSDERDGRSTTIVQADYTKSVEQVYHSVAVRSIETSEDLMILNAVQNLKSLGRLESVIRRKYPTWVPWWDPGWRGYTFGTQWSFDASLSRSKNCHFADDNKMLLCAKGIRVDLVLTVSPSAVVRSVIGTLENSSSSIEAIWREQLGFMAWDSRPSYTNGESALWAYLDTLAAAQSPIHGGPRDIQPPTAERIRGMAHYVTEAFDRENIPDPKVAELAENGDSAEFRRMVHMASWNRRFAKTERGYYLLCPEVVEEGDVLCVLFGGKTPFVLRPSSDSRSYFFIGECYAHGLMNGEAITMLEKGELEECTFTIK